MTLHRPSFLLPALLLCLLPAAAQRPHPATWSMVPDAETVAPGSDLLLELKLKLQEPWHMYSMTTPPGGPIPTSIRLEEHPAVGEWSVHQPPAKRKFDPNFQIDTDTYEKEVSFYIKAQIKPEAPEGQAELIARLRYQLCTETECMPPRPMTASARVNIAPGAPPSAAVIPAGYAEYRPGQPGPVEGGAAGSSSAAASTGLASFLAIAFGFGLAAIFTPCVFPMIPITISFFLNRGGGSRGNVVSQAAVFSLGIVTLFTGLGFAITALLGPFGLIQLGASPWVNGFIALVFFVFGLSLLGAFEITLPSGLLTRLNTASGRGGYLGTLMMGLTFSLTAFACVGPFVGTLLAASVQGDQLQPALGMLSFSAGLATPFFFLALFPGYLQRLPRSGGWMARVKIVMGFIILAAMLKYLSTVDQVLGWNLLTRERFLAFWVILFALPGLYLLGLIRMEGIKSDEQVGAWRLIIATVLLGFSIGLIPGMFGARLGELEPFVPAPAEGASLAFGGAPAGPSWIKDDYAGALAQARQENKLLFVSFTGYACTNCKWMKVNMFTKPEIASALDGFVRVELYTDGTDAVSQDNQQRQESRFQTVAIPFYAILDSGENVVATFGGLTKNKDEFLAFLTRRPAS